MATQTIGRSIISDSYGDTLATFADRPEPKREGPSYLTREQIARRFRWTDAQTVQAIEGGRRFPAARKRVDGGSISLVWLQSDVDRWAEDTRREAETLAALVARA